MLGNPVTLLDPNYSMIHEILFALNGNIGSFFKATGNKIQVDENLPLAPGERVLVNRILAVAGHYKRLKKFIDDIVLPQNLKQTTISENCKSQQYLLAFCSGLSEVLEPYRKGIVLLEQTILLDPHQPLTYVLSEIDEYACLLQVLNYIVDKIGTESTELSSCRILELLHRNSHSVVANVQVAVQRIQRSCHEVLFKQLGAWLFHGHLSAEKDFFIHKEEHDDEEIQVAHDSRPSNLYAAYSEFKLCNDLLPCYIPYSLAKNILYIGQTVVMIMQNPKNTPGVDVICEDIVPDVWGGRELEFERDIKVMQSADTFQLDSLTRLVDSVRLCVTQHLRRLAVDEAHLKTEVQLIKNLYLLGRGELFIEFIKRADTILSQPGTPLTLKESNEALRSAARSVHFEEEILREKFHIHIVQGEGMTGWDGLSLSCQVQWPLHLLFDEAAFYDYNCLFRFLLRVRRAQTNLHALWKCQMQDKRCGGCEDNPDLWQLRRNFTFLVDNLQYYLQVDVLESQYSIFMDCIEKADNFEDIHQAHSKALANIMSQSFLFVGKTAVPIIKTEGKGGQRPKHAVMKCLLALLDLSSDFCLCAHQLEKDESSKSSVDTSHDTADQLKAMDDAYIKHVGLLKQLLLGMRGQPSGVALSQLLLRLDFNSWITDHCVSVDHLLT